MSCEHDCDRPPRFPAVPWNRPGLSQLRYRIGDYATMRAHMLDGLVKAPVLAGWTHLDAEEPGVALLEGTALIGDILTFYQQLYANETKLPTAGWEESVFDLVRLTGYRPAPGLGGFTTLALNVAERTVVPAGFAFQAQLEGFDQPSIFESSAAIEAFPAFGSFHLYRRRLGLQPIKGATRLDIARLGGKSDLVTRQGHGIEEGDRILLLSGPLDPSEILVVKGTEEHLDRVTLQLEGAVQENHPGEVTAFKIGRSFRHFGADAPHEFSTFFENPPKTVMHDTKFKRRTASITSIGKNYSQLNARQMPLDQEVDDLAVGSRVICVGRVVNPQTRDFAFIRLIEKITPRDVLWAGVTSPTSMLKLSKNLRTDTIGSGLIASLGASAYQYIEAIEVQSVVQAQIQNTVVQRQIQNTVVQAQIRNTSVQQASSFAVIDAEAVEVALSSAQVDAVFEIASGSTNAEELDIRRLRIYETLSEKMILRAPPRQVDGVSDGKVHYFGTREEAAALAGRRLLLSQENTTPEEIVVAEEQPELAATSGPPGDRRMWPVEMGVVPEAGPEGFDEKAPAVTVHGNLIDVTEGESQNEVAIGSGDTRRSFESFPIPKAPLTYLSDPVRSPPYSAELEIRVDGRLWQPVETFFDRPANAEIYVIRQTENGDFVQFGDGINGARLNSGQKNVMATYRVGHGSWGDLAVDEEPKAKGKLKPLKGVLMPGPATGGALPEEMTGARVAAPGRMQSLGRLVGLLDYEAEALAVPGVLKTGAVFGAEAERPFIALTVLTEDESVEAVSAVESALRHADRCRGPARYPLEVIAGQRRYVHLSLLLGYDPAYRSADLNAAIMAALGALPELDEESPAGGLFSLEQRSFGQDVHISQAIMRAQSVEGVVWVRPVALAKLAATAEDPGDLVIPNNPGLTPRISVTPSEVLALSAFHLTLSATTVSSDEECPT